VTGLAAFPGTLARTFVAGLVLAVVVTVMPVLAAAPGNSLVVQSPWMRKAPGVDTAAVYMVLRNTGTQAVTVTNVTSPFANHVMIHETTHEGGQSRMRMQETITIPAGKSVAFEPGGLHVMFSGFTQDVSVGQKVPFTLVLDNGDEVKADALVRPLDAQ